MTIKQYLGGKITTIACHLAAVVLALLILFALIPKGGREILLLIAAVYLICAFIPLAIEYRGKKAFYDSLTTAFERLDRKNLLAEMITAPDFFEGRLLYDILKASNKAYLEEINTYKKMQAEYRDYIEMWVHEIKTPISSSKLIAHNNRSEAADSISEELDLIENYVEQALFYARSNAVEKDYMIKEISLEKTVYAALKRDFKGLVGGDVSVSVNHLDVTVYSDAKWIEFILHQLIINAIKYASESEARIEITAKELENSCVLTVFDNGLGINEAELPKIFDKGFTGTNGRLRGKSTGMGLYISKKLCHKLGISIGAESTPGVGTAINLVFPKNSMTDII